MLYNLKPKVFIGLDPGFKGSIVMLNEEGLPIYVYTLPIKKVNGQEKKLSNGLVNKEEIEEIKDFVIEEYKDVEKFNMKFLKEQHKNGKTIKKNGTGKRNKNGEKQIKSVKKIKNENWYDMDKLMEIINEIKDYVYTNNCDIYSIIETQSLFIGKTKNASKILRGYGLLEGLLYHFTPTNKIEVVSPKEWQNKMFNYYLSKTEIEHLKFKDIQNILDKEPKLTTYFPDISARLLRMAGNKSVNYTKLASIYCFYKHYKTFMLSQVDRVSKDNGNHKVLKVQKIPNIELFYLDVMSYIVHDGIMDAFNLANYLRMITLN